MIDWTAIANAVQTYKDLGFEYIETPWVVDLSTAYITCDPSQAASYDYCDTDVSGMKALVGSAEQGFLQLVKENQLDATNYVSCGPCFRKETLDELHQPYFVKVELFSRCPDENLAKIVSREFATRAMKIMKEIAAAKQFSEFKIEFVYTGDMVDIEINGIEVGSYGFRFDEEIGWWAYGTGLAEPRFTKALKS